MKYDCVVIGSGVSGLTSALFLALNGKRVAVVERYSSMTPLLRRFKRGNVWCDTGFHYSGGLQQSGQFTLLLRYMGVEGKIQGFPMNPECFDIISIEGKEDYFMPYGLERIQDYLCSRFPDSYRAVKKYIEKIEAVNRGISFSNYDLDFGEIPGEFYSNQSLRDFLLESGAEEDLIELLGNHGIFLYGASADEIPLFVHLYIMGSFYYSSSTIVRGGDAIADAFQTRLEDEGVDIYCNNPVSGIKVDDYKKVCGVETKSGMILECDTCISTIHPRLLIDILPKNKTRPAFINRLKRLENTFAPFVVFFDLDFAPERISETNFYRFNSSKDGSYDSKDIAFMAVNQKAEPSGKKSLAVITTCNHKLFKKYLNFNMIKHEKSYSDLKESIKEEVTQSVFENFPELKGNVRITETITPVTFNRYTGTYDGSIYGVKQTVNQRALSTITSIKGLYLAGQSITPGVLGAVVSGVMAVSKIIDPGEFWNKVRNCY